MIFVFGTNIVLHYIRKSNVMTTIERDLDPLASNHESWLSAVSVGEIRSIAMQNRWGEERITQLDAFLSRFLIADVNIAALLYRYAEIDSYSQGNYSAIPSSFTSRNMGKNDLWIAAIASVLEATLLTTDSDFDHLNGVFLQLVTIANQSA